MENVAEFSDMLGKLNDFNFDIFRFDEISREKAIYYYTAELFGKYDFFKTVNEDKFKNFIFEIKDGYSRNNSYHNDIHATDVLQSCVSIVENGNFIEVIFCFILLYFFIFRNSI